MTFGERKTLDTEQAAFFARTTNCRVEVYSDVQALVAGQPVGRARETRLYQGRALFVSPRRDWQQAAAIEGTFGGTLKLMGCGDLSKASRVVLGDFPMGGAYGVLSVSTPNGVLWRLDLGRRQTA